MDREAEGRGPLRQTKAGPRKIGGWLARIVTIARPTAADRAGWMRYVKLCTMGHALVQAKPQAVSTGL